MKWYLHVPKIKFDIKLINCNQQIHEEKNFIRSIKLRFGKIIEFLT